MGNKTSALEFEGFEKNEISRLSKRFKKLDTDRWDPANLKVLKALLSWNKGLALIWTRIFVVLLEPRALLRVTMILFLDLYE